MQLLRIALYLLFIFPCLLMATTKHPINANSEILLGMSNALTGPASGLGLELKKGAQIYFNQINQQGGINGKAIKLISYDDGYEPEQAYKNTQQLIYNDKVFALFGYVGTPTSKAALPIIKKEHALYFAPFTGADFLRTPVIASVFNVRGSYYEEVAMQVNYFVNHKNYSKIGLFIQADAFGLAVTRGIDHSLKAQKIKPIVNTRFKRNSNNIENALNSLLVAAPQVVFCVGTYQPIAELINKMRAEGYRGDFVSVSFVGASSLASRLNSLQGVYVSSVVPSPKDPTIALVAEYQQAMNRADFHEYSHESLEGYLNAKVFVEIAKQCAPLTVTCFIRKAENFRKNLGGLVIRFSQDNHQGLNKVYLQSLASGFSVIK